MARTLRLFSPAYGGTLRAGAAPMPSRRRTAPGNQARLRGACRECEEDKNRGKTRCQSARADKNDGGKTDGAKDTAPAKPTSVDVWGLPVNRSMCGCKQRIRDDIDWANEAAKTYASCNKPTNKTSDDVEACFKAAHPDAVVVATTDSSGNMNLPAASKDPCETIANKATFVHETMHSRHADDMAKAQGPAFYAEWQKLKGAKDRLEQIAKKFPTETDNFLKQWTSGADWASDEVHSYTWERRFLEDALKALNQIC